MNPTLRRKICHCGWSSNISSVAVVGGGLCGLTAAIRLAELGVPVILFEAAPKLGGRTRSFLDSTVSELCDNGPHLLVGAYTSTERLLNDCGASHAINWQRSLQLPCWEKERGSFSLTPSRWLPLPLALPLAVSRMPGHGLNSALAMLRIGLSTSSPVETGSSVSEWMKKLGVPKAMIRDMIEPLCLGAMNEQIDTASAASFLQVLKESFATHKSARLGWFNASLDEALIDPLVKHAESLGVKINTSCRIRRIETDGSEASIDGETFKRVILALPAYATDRVLNRDTQSPTEMITNLHLWLDQPISFNGPFIGGIGTAGEWFFDVSSQMRESGPLQHLCVVISADRIKISEAELLQTLSHEIEQICGRPVSPVHHRLVREKRATVLVRPHTQQKLPAWLIDASERPAPGELPATIEMAVRRGEKAANQCVNSLL
ncbi:squalene-associated FAD-dependent desaturase [Mariprofundus aestuarium]|uniref:Squalene-associated FAD-dependent desaturase n=1 Tax=Mariprofundus aestuarium TaxID=1921086 RepID=A0A2K8KXP0_MARES|nr:FAD-dependent oxidoreductase [Mariprofundus aestuarium]ATX79740.1 squalene-associated FAD-dependent desaturase [Mariprofundus aestuarium]